MCNTVMTSYTMAITQELLRAACPPTRERRVNFDFLSDDIRWWIGGHMDGDGCVRVCPINGLTVRIGKAENAWASLVHLKRFMGGCIYNTRGDRGERQAERQWWLRGQAALDFCHVIQHYSFLKKEQLVKACEFPLYGGWIKQMKPVKGTHIDTGETIVFASTMDAIRKTGITGVKMNLRGKTTQAGCYVWEFIENPVKAEHVAAKRAELELELAAMKKVEHAEITHDLPLPYIAGFVDADGCIRAGVLTVAQKFRAVCDAIETQFGGTVREHTDRYGDLAFVWYAATKARAVSIVQLLLPYLIEKKAQAVIMLSDNMTDDQKNAAMSKMKGHQGAAANAQNRATWNAMLQDAEQLLVSHPYQS